MGVGPRRPLLVGAVLRRGGDVRAVLRRERRLPVRPGTELPWPGTHPTLLVGTAPTAFSPENSIYQEENKKKTVIKVGVVVVGSLTLRAPNTPRGKATMAGGSSLVILPGPPPTSGR